MRSKNQVTFGVSEERRCEICSFYGKTADGKRFKSIDGMREMWLCCDCAKKHEGDTYEHLKKIKGGSRCCGRCPV